MNRHGPHRVCTMAICVGVAWISGCSSVLDIDDVSPLVEGSKEDAGVGDATRETDHLGVPDTSAEGPSADTGEREAGPPDRMSVDASAVDAMEATSSDREDPRDASAVADERQAADAPDDVADAAEVAPADAVSDRTIPDADEIVLASILAPRLIAPLSTATVTSQRPALRWLLPSGVDGARVDICRDRACVDRMTTFDVTGQSAVPTTSLSKGTYFWRAYGRKGAARGQTPSPTWQFSVGPRSAPVDSSFGTTLDLNGDGYADVVIGAYGATPSGRAYVYYGGPLGIAAMPSLTLDAPDEASKFGSSAASAGDVNGDGYADLIVGYGWVSGSRAPGSGRVYLYFGGRTGIPKTPSVFLPSPPEVINFFGDYVESAGDVNGDGYGDVLVGDGAAAQGACDVNADGYGDLLVARMPASEVGATYLYLGSATGPSTRPAVSFFNKFDGTGGAYLYLGSALGPSSTARKLTWAGDDLQRARYPLPGSGDVNGDGYADVVITGTVLAEGGADPEWVDWVYHGSASGLMPTPTKTIRSGARIGAGGDVNGDGYTDYAFSGFGGGAIIHLGGPNGLGESPAATFACVDPTKFACGQTVTLTDTNGDGFSDVLMSATDPLGHDRTGRAYLYAGGNPIRATLPPLTLVAPDGYESFFGSALARRRRSGDRRTRASGWWMP